MRKSLVILMCLFLFACSDSGIIFAGTPEEALQKLDSKEDNFKITKVLTSTSDNEKRGFYIFEGEVDDKTEWFVANIVTNDLYWYVKDFVNIGAPSSKNESYSSRTNTFTAGLINETNETKNNRIIVGIPESDFSVWIELNDNKK